MSKTTEALHHKGGPYSFDLFGMAADQEQVETPKKRTGQPKPAKAVKPASPQTILRNVEESDETEDDSSQDIDLDSFAAGDTTETFLAKRMFARMMSDLAGEIAATVPDMFGQIVDEREQRKQDALIWMFDLNPDGSEMPFTWVCDEIGFDYELVRRITGRSVRQDMKRILKLLSSMVSHEHAKTCELNLMEYVNLSGWELH
jgi:hypothetical protein